MGSLPSPPSEKEVEQYLLKLQNTLLRRDSWNDVEALTTWLKKQFPWNRWDPRILELYIVSTSLAFVVPIFVLNKIP